MGGNHRWKVLGVGFAANASFSAAFSGIPTTAIFLRNGYHIGNGGLGLVLGMLGLGIAISELPWGLLTDRWGDRRVLLLGLLTTAAALTAMAGFVVPNGADARGIVPLALGLLAVGLLGGSVNGSSGRAVMAWFREGERGLAMSIRQTAVPAGGGLGALALPSLAAHFGFVAVYGVLAVLCAVTAWFAWCWLHEPPVAAASGGQHAAGGELAASPAEPAAPAMPHSPLRDSGVWRVALGIGVLCVPQLAVVTFATVFLHDFGHAGVLEISGTMVAVQAGAAVARVWSGRWTDRHGNRRQYMRACSVLTALLFATLALIAAGANGAHGAIAVVLAAMVVLGGVSASAWHGVAYTELATLAGTRRAGTALAMGNTCAFMTLFVTPLAIPPLLAATSWPAVWAIASVCALIALPVFPRPVRTARYASRARA
ncbi:major facilitator superfamily protein [Paraburkholderia hospita]|uniref:Major facilitator superfamily protein n=1 Tax=Paraburkholderia hospita TaxID=169430 RepID=A0ABN0FRR5_9BURK|nr:MFS transporter [Paraburkholderia hospita]EIN01448.1 major facilitator superfamily protein [Paraburkholderia hospita]OUL76077.1 MFS transporter [Paraburkholderia hospita]